MVALRIGHRAPRLSTVGAARITLLAALLVALLAAVVVPAAAEVSPEVSIDIYNSLLIGDEVAPGETVAATGAATAQLDLRNSGSRDVRSWFQLRSTLAHRADGSPATMVDVPRAEVRWRMTAGESYTMRYTAGRTRLTWGDGVLYNAGDVLNGAAPDATDLTADTLREETLWLLSAYFPLGRFSFMEPVLLVPMGRLAADSTTAGSGEDSAGTATTAPVTTARPASEVGAGGRMQGQVGGIKSEVGYLYRGTTDDHRPYLSLQGNLVVDWYGGGSWSSSTEDWVITGGVVYNGSTDRRGSWSARTEALWESDTTEAHLFPELTWSPSQLFSLFVRGITSSHGDAVNGAAGFTWTPSTGLSLALYGTTDTDREVGAVTTAVTYVF